MSISCHYRSLFSTLQHHTRLKDLQRGKPLHAHIITTGSSSCVYIANALINLYVKSGHLHTAHLVFETIPHKDVVSWNTLINGYSQQGFRYSSFVLELFRRMRGENTSPDSHTFAGVCNAASYVKAVLGGRQVHTVAVKAVGCFDVFVGSSLVNMYCKMGLVRDARKVFDEMLVRNSVTWATMISGYAMQQLGANALEVFIRMRRSEEREEENEFVLTAVLSGLAGPEFVETGKQIHCLAVKNGLMCNVSVGNALVTMYAKCGCLDDALRTFELCGDKNSITWSAMISGFAQSADSQKALDLFSDMHFSGMVPTEFAFGGVISACSDINALEQGKQVHSYLLKLGFEFQLYIISALVDMYGKCGSVSDARKGFDCIKEPDIVLWSSMIGGYVQNGENEAALSLYCRMQREGFLPNELTMASLLKACSSLCAFEQGKQIHSHTIKYGFSLEFPIGSSLFTMYAKCGNLEDGKLVFRRMPTRDVVSWNAMISGLSQNGQGNEALELFEEMRLGGTEPDFVTFVNVLSACSHMGSVERGWIYFKMMSNEFGIAPRVEHYACMVDVLSRAGKLDEAKDFIESATIDHGICLWRILLSACRNYRNYELGAYAGEKLMELGSLESQAYVLLSSIYSSLGRREDIERVRRMMKLRGVSKKPGCSWIELKSQVHVFVVGDMMHPQIESIGVEIRRLIKHMKDEGYQPSSTTF
ncbi:pentatricopeptide repeat-containing protein At2g33680-like [Rosa rugosa]|uniref:pentatricopeptide repeat-containing protein At2g33680-like n=1 Tax=Rosa rugosa TaxID=74645 RepID=UPI002B41816D|nr:pentatricopeptide repeat-containing protein At2g33680-like [Rosa rugosa]XP_062001602.1 pentatricopeptide repeat-containing protein At2g33680-like [Rosa rugosa]XP_062001603.1 pentatricopeptide repeat-containing protein At2g33680-like [Rosa rugosa]